LTDLQKRTITGFLFAITLIGGMLYSKITFFLLFLTITVLGMWEFYNLSRKDNILPQKYIGIFFGIIVFITNYLFANHYVNEKVFLLYIPLSLSILVVELYSKNAHPFSNISFSIFGVLYVALPFSLLNYLTTYPAFQTEYTPKIVLGFFFLMWASDTGAYLVGSQIGKRRLFKRISPKKSWEGSIGGAVAALAVACGIAYFFTELSLIHWLVIAVITVLMGTYGDLVESLFKRSLDIKDSGSILPGHGGILDRFDSVLVSAPLVYAYLYLIV